MLNPFGPHRFSPKAVLSETRSSPAEVEADVYLTDGRSLFRVLSRLYQTGAPEAVLEDCRTLEIGVYRGRGVVGDGLASRRGRRFSEIRMTRFVPGRGRARSPTPLPGSFPHLRMGSGFADRRDAGRRLAAMLDRFRDADPVVVGIPRGGVPVAAEAARELRAPLDVVLVRKVGAPGSGAPPYRELDPGGTALALHLTCGEESVMPECEVCGNDYDKAMQITLDGASHTFECAIQALAPQCAHCDVRIVGHRVEADGAYYCCAHCAHRAGVDAARDRV